MSSFSIWKVAGKVQVCRVWSARALTANRSLPGTGALKPVLARRFTYRGSRRSVVIFKQFGVYRASSIEEFFDIARACAGPVTATIAWRWLQFREASVC